MNRYRTLVICLFSGFALTVVGCTHGSGGFKLSSKVVTSENVWGASRLAIELKNVSGREQNVDILTNVFEGSVYLRTASGEVHEFTQREYLSICVSAFFIRPTCELAPGASLNFEHGLNEFVDFRRWVPNNSSSMLDGCRPLTMDLDQGCVIWCELIIRQRGTREQTGLTTYTSTKVTSQPIAYKHFSYDHQR